MKKEGDMMLGILNLLKERVAIAKVSSDNSNYLIKIAIGEAAEGIEELEQKPGPENKVKMTGVGWGVTYMSEGGVHLFFVTHDGMKVLAISENQYHLFRELLNAWHTKERLVTVIREVIELMDEEPAKEILKKAVKYE